ncbi:MAG: AAA family ATPase [Desulfobacteraceae bacterium]
MTVIVCPKCAKKHNISADAVKKKLPSAKSFIAKCKACHNRFPVSIDQILDDEKSKKVEPDRKIKNQPARKLCIALSKGGVGKTTTSTNLGACLALAGYKVLIVDTDTQGQVSYLLGKKPKSGLTELLTAELEPQEILIKARENLWLLAGGKSLAGVKRIIDRKSFGAEWTLHEAMKPFEYQYDFIIIDTAPGWDQLSVNVFFYATEVLVPVALEFMPLQGLSEFLKSLGSIQRYRRDVELKYILPTFMDARIKGPQEIFAKLKQLYPEYICKPIRYSESLSEAPSFGKTIFEFAPGCNASADYRELARKVTLDDSLLL